jgi:hypothetical protein
MRRAFPSGVMVHSVGLVLRRHFLIEKTEGVDNSPLVIGQKHESVAELKGVSCLG